MAWGWWQPRCSSGCSRQAWQSSGFSATRAGGWKINLRAITPREQLRGRPRRLPWQVAADSLPRGLLLFRDHLQDLAREIIRESEACLGPRIEINGLLVEPDHGRFAPAITRARAVIGRAHRHVIGAVHGVVVESNALAGNGFRALEGFGEAMEGAVVGVEDEHLIEQRRILGHAMVHGAVPQLDGPAPLLPPVRVQVQNEIDAAAPMLVVMVVGKVRVHIEETAPSGLMQSAALKHGIGHQASDAG